MRMHWYTDVITKKYFEFDGRAGRQEYWMFTLFNVIVAIVVGIIGGVIGQPLIADLYFLAILLPSLGLAVRRLHDIGKSGWWIFISLIPLIGFIVLLVFAIMDSEPGNNQYGPNPKGVGGEGDPAAPDMTQNAEPVPPPAAAQPTDSEIPMGDNQDQNRM